MYMNQLTIIGFTGQDAELHYTQNGTPVTTLSVATKESWKNDQGEWQSRTEWHRIVAFGKLAEYAKTLPKGSHLLVQGPLRSREGRPEAPRHGTPRRQHRQTRPGSPLGGGRARPDEG
jgi:single-strand DNA-binding protein